jgi:hypothetical protein
LKSADLCFLADGNIHPEAVRYLRSMGRDVLGVGETGLIGAPDIEIL